MIIRFSLMVLSLLLAGYFVQGIEVNGLYTSIIVAILLVVSNITIKPVLTLLMLPVHILTLGLSVFLINVGIFWFLSSFVEGFVVSGFLAAVLGSLIVSLSTAISSIIS